MREWTDIVERSQAPSEDVPYEIRDNFPSFRQQGICLALCNTRLFVVSQGWILMKIRFEVSLRVVRCRPKAANIIGSSCIKLQASRPKSERWFAIISYRIIKFRLELNSLRQPWLYDVVHGHRSAAWWPLRLQVTYHKSSRTGIVFSSHYVWLGNYETLCWYLFKIVKCTTSLCLLTFHPRITLKPDVIVIKQPGFVRSTYNWHALSLRLNRMNLPLRTLDLEES